MPTCAVFDPSVAQRDTGDRDVRPGYWSDGEPLHYIGIFKLTLLGALQHRVWKSQRRGFTYILRWVDANNVSDDIRWSATGRDHARVRVTSYLPLIFGLQCVLEPGDARTGDYVNSISCHCWAA